MASKPDYSSIKQKYKLSETIDIRKDIRKILETNPVKIVILDDDPTGIQTVHGCILITNWEEATVEMAFENKNKFFYILTNSRSMDSEQAKLVNEQAVYQILKVNKKYNYKLIFISRSDSTLRGHFPAETESIRKILNTRSNTESLPVFFIPAFIEVGRYTINNVQYLKSNDELIPVNETEFSRDKVFGYKNANLIDYIKEKTNNIQNDEIGSLSIDDLRLKSVNEIVSILKSQIHKKYIIVNALDYTELQKFSLSYLKLILTIDNHVVLRTSSSLPKALSGIEDKPLLTKKSLLKTDKPGIILVGSHVHKTTLQLGYLLNNRNVKGIEINIHDILHSPKELLTKILIYIKELWICGTTPVLYTSRREFIMDDEKEKLALGRKISDFLVEIVRNIPSAPAYIISKGGITSHNILTHGLKLNHATVAGQILDGVPVVITSKEHRFADLPFIIFPGNVGDNQALSNVFNVLN